nr:uncharacterized protein LOC117692049 [Crassostrea gigas]
MNACPIFYRSDEAYKYQGCYQLTKKSTTGTNNPMSTRNPDYTVVFTTTSANISSNMSTNKHVEMSEEEEKMDPKPIVIAVIVIALSIAIIGFIVFAVWKRNGKKPKRRQSLEKRKAGQRLAFPRLLVRVPPLNTALCPGKDLAGGRIQSDYRIATILLRSHTRN